MRFLVLAQKDIMQLMRERRTLLFIVLMPIAFTVFMGIATKGSSQNSDPRPPLGWVSHNPSGLTSKTLHDFLSQSEVVRLVDLDPALTADELSTRVRSGKLAGALVIPANFNKFALNDKSIAVTLVVDDFSTNGQEVIEAVRGAMTRLMSSVEIADLVLDTLGSNDEQLHTSVFQEASAAWKKTAKNGLSYSVEKAQETHTVSSILAENPYKQTSPGILVQFAIFGLVTSAGILVEERKTGTLQRLMTTSMSRAEIIGGHMLAMFSIVFLQSILLVLFGQFVLNVDYFRQPLAVVLVLGALGLWVSSLGLFIGVFAKDESQVVLFSLICMFLFSALGGCWFPIETVGQGFAAAAHLTPSFYALQGLQNILVREQGFTSVLLPALILLVFALLFFGVALQRFEKTQQR